MVLSVVASVKPQLSANFQTEVGMIAYYHLLAAKML